MRRADDAEGDRVVDRGVLLLLDRELGAVLELPGVDVGLVGTGGGGGRLEGGPPLAEVLELDQVPDLAQGLGRRKEESLKVGECRAAGEQVVVGRGSNGMRWGMWGTQEDATSAKECEDCMQSIDLQQQ